MFYKMTIIKTASETLKSRKRIYDENTYNFKSLSDLVAKLMELYPELNSKNISKKQCIYRDKINGESINTGFCISFWDYCYNECRKFHETHWIEFFEVIEEVVDLTKVKNHLKLLETEK